MQVRFHSFRQASRTWQEPFEDAAAFASKIPPERLITISQSGDHMGGSVVTVWYWADEGSGETVP